MKVLASLLLTVLAALPLSAAEKLRVSSFSTILTEIAGQVGGDRVAVTAHVKPGIDPHDFQPKPADLKIVASAQLILLSAKHMEGYVGKLQQGTGAKGVLLEVGDGFSSLKIADHHDPAKLVDDPHWWHSVGNMEKATKIVRDALSKISPEDKALFSANAAKYLDQLAALEKWAKRKVAELPRDRRQIVTSHEAFQYFAREHGFTIHAIEGVTRADQPSSKKVAEIVETIRRASVKAIFPESLSNPKVLKEITRETGAKIGPELHGDGLGTGAASTYEGMYRHNVTAIVDALK
jgi:zinc/manganese transport system substrate-binding protein